MPFSEAEVKAAREYWGALSDEELHEFHRIDIEGKSSWIGVDENTSYEDYLVITARQSQYEKEHDI